MNMNDAARYRELLQDLVEIIVEDVENQSDRLVEVLHRARRILAEGRTNDNNHSPTARL